MEKVWPTLPECVQFKYGLMREAKFRYPWEDDEYAFDFESYFPPIPDELACLRKLLDCLRKTNYDINLEEDTRDCPFCPQDPYPESCPVDEYILNHPVWDMDPTPCPCHIFNHVWPQGGCPAIITPQELENTKKYLNQVRNSRGYDVDCFPHPNLVYSPFQKSGIDDKSKVKSKLESTVIPHIKLKTGKNYELDEVLKIVSTDRLTILVTFTAKVDDSAAVSETFIATLAEELTLPNIILECLLKPNCAAPGPNRYPDSIQIQPIEIPLDMKLSMLRANHPRTQDKFTLWGEPRNECHFFFERSYSFRISTVAELSPVDKEVMLEAGIALPPGENERCWLEPGCVDTSSEHQRRVEKRKKSDLVASPLLPEHQKRVEKQKKRDLVARPLLPEHQKRVEKQEKSDLVACPLLMPEYQKWVEKQKKSDLVACPLLLPEHQKWVEKQKKSDLVASPLLLPEHQKWVEKQKKSDLVASPLLPEHQKKRDNCLVLNLTTSDTRKQLEHDILLKQMMLDYWKQMKHSKLSFKELMKKMQKKQKEIMEEARGRGMVEKVSSSNLHQTNPFYSL